MFDPSDTLIIFGGEVKALGDGRVEGPLVRFNSPDVQGDVFTASTHFGPSRIVPIYYHHGIPRRNDAYSAAFGNAEIGTAEFKARDDMLWVVGQLDMSRPAVAKLYEDVAAGRMGWSSGTSERFMAREPVKGGPGNLVTRWPLNDASITPTPVDPKNRVVAVKALLDACKGEHLGQHAEHGALIAALDHLNHRAGAALHNHIHDGSKPRKAKLAACKATYAEHHAAAMKAIDAMLPDDGDGDEGGSPDSRREAMKAWLEGHAPRVA